MADVKDIKNSDFIALLNCTKYGTVTVEYQFNAFKKQRIKFSARSKTHLFKFLASMLDKRHNPQKASDRVKDYDKVKEYARKRNAERSASGRDIGKLPAVVDPQRKEACRLNLKLFLEYYLTQTFKLKWSPDHLKAIKVMETAILTGGLFAFAMPRGTGKTSICEGAGIWALAYAHRPFIVLIGATEPDAGKMLDSIKTEWETNEALADDFPEIVFPIKALEGINIRANGQTQNGMRTCISWNSDEIVLPTIEGSLTSGIAMQCAGITGRIRGRKHKKQDGTAIRPSLVIIDDPQTDESAKSPQQCKNRTSILSKAIIGLAGVGNKIAGFMPCTVIQREDMADQILDRDKYPEWQGQKTKMVLSFPDEIETLWKEYDDLRIDSLQQGLGISLATKFYIENQKEMDKGCEVYWQERFNEDEHSAIQNAMNLFFTNQESFYSEYQNEPMEDLGDALELIKPDEFMQKINRVDKMIIPVGGVLLVTYIDVQKKALYYVTCAFDEDYNCSVVDYGTYPDQK